jgi:hypothetical protein
VSCTNLSDFEGWRLEVVKPDEHMGQSINAPTCIPSHRRPASDLLRSVAIVCLAVIALALVLFAVSLLTLNDRPVMGLVLLGLAGLFGLVIWRLA